MTSKLRTIGWSLDGPGRQVRRFQDVLANAEFGQGWGQLISKVAEDATTQDKGGFIELLRPGSSADGPVVGLAHLDAARCALTGDLEWPVVYVPVGGRPAKLAAHQVLHIVSHPSPDEALHDIGFCAVSRCLKAAQIMRDIHLYKSEKLASAPNRGLVIVQGMTQKRLEAAFAEAEEAQQNQGLTRFAKVVMLATQDAGTPLHVEQLDFASLPDSYNEETSITLYVYILALAFGVDAREFWPATASGATKADALVQAMKARGKGIGDLLTAIERQLNWKVLPDSLTFRFDFQDDEEDRARADLDGVRIGNVAKLYSPPTGLTEGLITRAEGRQMLADVGIVPQEFMAAEGDLTPNVTVDDVEQGQTPEEMATAQPTAAPEAAPEMALEAEAAKELRRLFGPPVRYSYPDGRTVSLEAKQRRPFVLSVKAAAKLVEVPLPDDVDEVTNSLEGKFTDDALKGLRRVEKAVIERLRAIAKPDGKALKEDPLLIVDDDDFWRQMDLWLQEALQPIVGETAMAGAESAAGAVLNALAIGVDMALVNTEVVKWTRTATLDLVSGLNDVTRDNLRQLMVDWQTTGLSREGLPDLIKALEPTFGKKRAEMIGVTEVTRAFAEGNALVYQEVPGAQGEKWKTANDELVCTAICAPLNGKVTKFDKAFSDLLPDDVTKGGQKFKRPPGHVRCRCRATCIVGELPD